MAETTSKAASLAGGGFKKQQRNICCKLVKNSVEALSDSIQTLKNGNYQVCSIYYSGKARLAEVLEEKHLIHLTYGLMDFYPSRSEISQYLFSVRSR